MATTAGAVAPQTPPATSKYAAPAAACAARLLLVLARNPSGLSLAELARETGNSRSLTFRVVHELEALDFVRSADGQGYQLAHAVLEFAEPIARLAPDKELELILRDLSDETAQTVNFGILREFDVLITAKQQPAQALVSVTYVGARIPANCSALGKALLAQLSPEQLETRIPSTLTALTSKSTTDRSQLAEETSRARNLGFATDLEGAILGRFAIAVPVRMGPSSPTAALAVTGSMDDYSKDHEAVLHQALLRAAQRIERAAARGTSAGD